MPHLSHKAKDRLEGSKMVGITVVSNMAMGYEKIQHLHWLSCRNTLSQCDAINGAPKVGGVVLNMIDEVRSGDVPPVAIPLTAIDFDEFD